MAAVGNFHEVTSDDHYIGLCRTDKLLIIAFYTVRCPACVQSGPGFAALAADFPQNSFVKVNCETFPDIADASSVTAFPTFQLRLKNKVLEQFAGADLPRLRKAIELHGQSRERLGSLAIPDSYVDLLAAVDRKQVTCLNEDDDNGNVIENLWGLSSDSYLKSDSGEQLLIHIPFLGECKLHSLKFGAKNTAAAPKTVWLFVNKPNLDFNEAEDSKPTQKIKLTPSSFGPAELVTLDFVIFQKVHCLSLFIEDNQEDEEQTILDHLLIIGVPPTNMDMTQFKRVSGKKGESHE